MNTTRRTLLTGFGAALTAAALPSCGGSGPSSKDQSDSLVIGLTYVPDIQFAPVYVADHFGWFTEQGLEITIRHHGAQESLFGALQSGDEHIVYAGGDEMLQARSQGVGIRNFATTYQTYPSSLIVAADSPVNTVADLAGHTIGLPGEYGENWFFLLAALESAGLSRAQVNITSIGYTQFSALTEGHVDAVVGFANSDLVRLRTSGFAAKVLEVDDLPLVALGFGAADEIVTGRADQLNKFMTAVRKAVTYCTENPDDTVELCTKYVETLSSDEQKTYALAVLQATNALYGTEFGIQNPQTWAAMGEFMAAHGLLGNQVVVTEAFTDAIG